MARRLVEAGVPFVTVFWMEDERSADKCQSAGGWDTHANNFACLKDDLLPEFDRGFSALIEDLSARGLLDQTLVLGAVHVGQRSWSVNVRTVDRSRIHAQHFSSQIGCLTMVLYSR